MDVYANNDCEFSNLDEKSLNSLIKQDKKEREDEDMTVMWYHGKMSRSDAEKTLKEATVTCPQFDEDGLFMVRDSTTSDVDFSLSFIYTGNTYHFFIHCIKEGYYRIDGGPLIHGLEKLIEHYAESPDMLPTRLSKLCKGRLPPSAVRRYGSTNILHRAVEARQEIVVKKILGHTSCPDIDAKNSKGWTALHEAAMLGLDKIVSLLLLHGADMRIKDIDGDTALHKACSSNKPSICTQLISHNLASLLEKNPSTGMVPLHTAAMHGHMECVEILLDSGGPIFPRSLNNETPVELAEKYRRNNCIKVLENVKESKVPEADEEFFHPALDRQGAEKLVRDHHLTDGLFLIRRKSQNVDDHTVLSLCHNKGVLNYEIKSMAYRGHKVHFIDMGPYHLSLRHLVQYYHHFDEGTPVKLQAYISRGLVKVDLTTVDLHPSRAVSNLPKPLVKPKAKNLPVAIRPELPSRPPDLEPPSPRPNPAHKPVPPFQRKIEEVSKPTDIPLKCIKTGRQLGEGEYGSVLQGTLVEKKKMGLLRKEKQIQVALKTFHCVGSMDDFKREAHVMQSLQHEYIVQLLGVCQGPPLMLVEEFVPMGSMLDFLEDHPQQVRVKEELYLWAAQIAMGMMYLETKSLVHRDLAARNILLKTLQHVKISDFGLSRAMGSDKEYYKASQGGRWPIKWYAPESVNYGHFSHASDVWSYGVTLWEMFTYGEAPFEAKSGVEVIKSIEEGHRLPRPEHCTPAVYKIMTQCWSLKPENRPTFTQLSHMFEEDPEYGSTKEIMAAINSSQDKSKSS